MLSLADNQSGWVSESGLCPSHSVRINPKRKWSKSVKVLIKVVNLIHFIWRNIDSAEVDRYERCMEINAACEEQLRATAKETLCRAEQEMNRETVYNDTESHTDQGMFKTDVQIVWKLVE